LQINELYSSASYHSIEVDAVARRINSGVDVFFSFDCVITFSDVVDVVRELKPAKYDGYAGLSTDYIINACGKLYVHIALLFSAMIVHGSVFDLLVIRRGGSITPIPKAKNINCTESTNYRGIAVSSIFGKILDRIIFSRYADKQITLQYQFGFKMSSFTAMFTMVLKETINYYTLNNGHMYSVYLDATKAFDKVK